MAACLVLCGTELHSTLIRMRLSRGGLREGIQIEKERGVTTRCGEANGGHWIRCGFLFTLTKPLSLEKVVIEYKDSLIV